jgi:superfamily II DNA or RNA helicase
MLRPTESAIVWQQQFGRGLRKTTDDKTGSWLSFVRSAVRRSLAAKKAWMTRRANAATRPRSRPCEKPSVSPRMWRR